MKARREKTSLITMGVPFKNCGISSVLAIDSDARAARLFLSAVFEINSLSVRVFKPLRPASPFLR